VSKQSHEDWNFIEKQKLHSTDSLVEASYGYHFSSAYDLPRGSTASVVKVTPEERSTAVRAEKIMGLSVAGVDWLRSNHGSVVMEVNSSLGLEGVEMATGKNVASVIVQFIEKHSKEGISQTRGKG